MQSTASHPRSLAYPCNTGYPHCWMTPIQSSIDLWCSSRLPGHMLEGTKFRPLGYLLCHRGNSHRPLAMQNKERVWSCEGYMLRDWARSILEAVSCKRRLPGFDWSRDLHKGQPVFPIAIPGGLLRWGTEWGIILSKVGILLARLQQCQGAMHGLCKYRVFSDSP